jgi:drug/metabolite transporter (DMT)-like permease
VVVQPYDPSDARAAARRPTVNARALWAGGVAAAVVAALVAVVGIVIARGLLDIPVLAPKGEGAFGDASTWGMALAAAAAALVATALLQVLLSYTPRPFAFFGWIVTLLTAVAVLVPFQADATLEAKIATGLINLLIGIAIGTLVGSVGARSLERRG